MQVDIRHQGQLQFEASARDHRILSDQPQDSGGGDQGMTPPEWFLASLGSCMGFYAVKYLQARHIDASSLRLSVTAEKVTAPPARLDNIHIRIHVGVMLQAKHEKGLKKAIESCLIHQTLQHPPAMNIDLNPAAVALT